MSEWKEYKLEELTLKIGSGATPRGGQESYKKEGISLIRSQNVIDYHFSYNGLAFIDETQAKALDNVRVLPRDILLNITGDSVARVCMVPDGVLPARVNQHVAIIRANQKILYPRYVLYFLLNPSVKKLMLRIASDGGTRNALTKSDIQNFKIKLPSNKTEQQKIAAILTSLDDKIDLLRRQNETLEAIIQTLFKRWFVEFEFPDENGLPYKSSGGKMVSSELYEIPEGWRVGKIGNICSILNEVIKPNAKERNLYFHYSIPAFDDGYSPKKEYGKDILSNKFCVKSNTILVSKLNPRKPRIWPILEIDEKKSISSTEFQVIKPIKRSYYCFIFNMFKSRYVRKEMAQRATGTSGSHQRIRPDDILDIDVVISRENLILDFEKVAKK